MDFFEDLEADAEEEGSKPNVDIAKLLLEYLEGSGGKAKAVERRGLVPTPEILPKLDVLRQAARVWQMPDAADADEATLTGLVVAAESDGVDTSQRQHVYAWLRLMADAAAHHGDPRSLRGLLAYRQATDAGEAAAQMRV